MTRERNDEQITLGRLAALFGVMQEWEDMHGHSIHNHKTEELMPKGECPRCDWLQEERPHEK